MLPERSKQRAREHKTPASKVRRHLGSSQEPIITRRIARTRLGKIAGRSVVGMTRPSYSGRCGNKAEADRQLLDRRHCAARGSRPTMAPSTACSVALEYAERGTRINAVCSGTIDTPMVSDVQVPGSASAGKPSIPSFLLLGKIE